MKHVFLAACLVSCTSSSDNNIKVVEPIKVESTRLKGAENVLNKFTVSNLLIHYDSDYGETHLKLFDDQTFPIEWKMYGPEEPNSIEEYVLKKGKWVLDKDSIANLSFEDNKHILDIFYTDKEYEKDFTFIDSKTLKFELKKTDIHIDGSLFTDFKRNCYCEK